MAKESKEEKETKVEVDYEERIKHLSVISQPLASKKLNKKVLKVVKKATKSKTVHRGVKEVVKGLRKGSKGLVIIAGDISPIDVISHIPVLCEDNNIPYIYVPSKEDLGSAGATKRPTSVVMIQVGGKGKEAVEGYEEALEEIVEIGKKMISLVKY